MPRKKKRVTLDTTLEGAQQLIDAADEHTAVQWDGLKWIPFDGKQASDIVILPLNDRMYDEDGSIIPGHTTSHIAIYGKQQFTRLFPPPFRLLTKGADPQKVMERLEQLELLLNEKDDHTHIPDSLPQQTAPEIHALARAIADGPSGRNWEALEGEELMVHSVLRAPFQVQMPGSMQAELKAGGIDGALLTYWVVAMVIKDDHPCIEVDGLIRALGWDPRSTDERQQMHRRVWRGLRLVSVLPVIGQRKTGKWTNPDTGEVIPTVSKDPLFVILGTDMGDDPEAPVRFYATAGETLRRLRLGKRHTLPTLGDLVPIGKLPAGQPSGVWARATALGLNQLWREAASLRTAVCTPGEDNHLSVQRKKPFTRREIFNRFPPSNPSVDDILNSSDPRRAQKYWNQDIRLLKETKIVGYYRELEELPAQRKGWQEAWLDQPLDIRPGPETTKQVAEIAKSAGQQIKRVTAAHRGNPKDSKLRERDSKLRERDSKLREQIS